MCDSSVIGDHFTTKSTYTLNRRKYWMQRDNHLDEAIECISDPIPSYWYTLLHGWRKWMWRIRRRIGLKQWSTMGRYHRSWRRNQRGTRGAVNWRKRRNKEGWLYKSCTTCRGVIRGIKRQRWSKRIQRWGCCWRKNGWQRHRSKSRRSRYTCTKLHIMIYWRTSCCWGNNIGCACTHCILLHVRKDLNKLHAQEKLQLLTLTTAWIGPQWHERKRHYKITEEQNSNTWDKEQIRIKRWKR